MRVRAPAVAGRFYPGDPRRLAAAVAGYLTAPAPGPPSPPTAARAPEAEPGGPARLASLVVPHAGYPYSGPTAGVGYRLLPARAGEVRRVLLLGPAHYVPVGGVAASSADAWHTPLGDVVLDREARAALLRRSAQAGGLAYVDDEAHEPEHSLEVQVPFLQRVLPGIPLLPLLVGSGDSLRVADLLDPWWRDPGTLVVVSTDLSHYEPVEVARRLDARTAAAIARADADGVGDRDACGARPLRAILRLAARDGARVRVLDLRTSADTAGDPSRVVGYGAFEVAVGPC